MTVLGDPARAHAGSGPRENSTVLGVPGAGTASPLIQEGTGAEVERAGCICRRMGPGQEGLRVSGISTRRS